MSDENNNEENIESRECMKAKLSVKNGVLFAILGCVCLALAWWTTYAAERIYAQDYSDAFVVFFLSVFFMFAGTMLYKIVASLCLGVCFMLCLLALWYGIALMVRYVRIKQGEETTLSGGGTSRTVFVLCIISVIISVVVIALGIWFAVRLSMV